MSMNEPAMTTRRRVLGVTAAAAAASVLPAAPAWAAYTTRIDPARNYGAWQGWGVSLSWWAHEFGADTTLADLIFTSNMVSFRGRSLPGLGLNVVRYNLGAHMCQPVWPGGAQQSVSPNEPAFKKIEGFWVNWLSNDPSNTGSWNWCGDSQQRAALLNARDRGANVFELFSCSPIWWMCKNHNPCGAADGSDNLQTWNYQQHARYIAIVTKYAKDNWGVDFSSVEPFNEPSAPWWRANGTQEGCHISAGPNQPIQQQIIRYLRQELDARGLANVAVAASDETSYTQSRITWNNLAALGAQQFVGQVNTHGYEYGNTGTARAALYRTVAASGKRLWQSEYGEMYEHGLYLAYNLSLDLRYLHPTAWCYWQPVDSQVAGNLSWGLLKATYDSDPNRMAGTLGDPTPYPGTDPYVTNKYFVLAQYSRHIRPGMQIIDSGDQATVAAYDPNQHRLVLVTVRGNTSQRITYDLSAFSTVGTTTRRWVTDADPNYRIARQYQPVPAAALNGKRLTLLFGANSIQTIEIDNVHI